MKKFTHTLLELWDDLLVYFMTLVSILAVPYLPLLKSGGDILLSIHWGNIIIAGVAAFYFVLRDETKAPGKNEDGTPMSKAKLKERKRNNLQQRLAAAMGWGFTASTAISAILGS